MENVKRFVLKTTFYQEILAQNAPETASIVTLLVNV